MRPLSGPPCVHTRFGRCLVRPAPPPAERAHRLRLSEGEAPRQFTLECLATEKRVDPRFASALAVLCPPRPPARRDTGQLWQGRAGVLLAAAHRRGAKAANRGTTKRHARPIQLALA